MSIEKISDAARDAASVGALADRPQATERDGYSGMTPTQLKAAFDALPKLNTAKINEIIDLINGESTESLAYLLQTPVEYQGNTMTLYEFLAAIQGGGFGDIAMIGSRTLSAAIDHAAGEVFDTKMAGVTAEATTLVPGSPATASYNNSTKKFTFGIPKGDPGSGGGGGGDDVFVAIKDTTTFSEVYAAYLAGKSIFAKDATYNRIYVLVEYVHNNYVNRFTFTGAKGSWDWGPAIGELILEEGDGWTMGGDTLLEKKGVISVGNYEYEVQRKALAITENGVTTTYYVADITTNLVH